MSSLEELLKTLVEVIGVSGHEEAVREKIRGLLPQGIECKVDIIGNLIATIGKGEPHVIMIAHMDELGFIVSSIEENGLVKLKKVGAFDDRYDPGKVLQIHTKQGTAEGVIGLPPPHLTVDLDSTKKVLQTHELYLDMGTRSKNETANLGVRVLDPVTYKKEFRIINSDYYCCRSIDDRFGCLTLIQVLHKLHVCNLHRKLTFVWSVQEETGLAGANVIATSIKADKAVVVDSYPTGDAPLTQFRLAPAKLGDGPVLRVKDHGTEANPKLVESVKKIASKHGIALGAGPTGGYTDGLALQEKGIPMVPITIPIRYMHSPVEMCHRRDLEELIELVANVAMEI
nr:M42 family metallopeptidase [Candidatus Njordarchaeum guaymaensis]